jgi:hypothetical protein
MSILILLAACGGIESSCAEADMFHVYAHPDGSFGGCTFESPRQVGDARCLGKPYTTSVWADGSLAHCYLDGPQTVKGVDYPEDASVSFWEDGTLAGWTLPGTKTGSSKRIDYKGTGCTKATVHANGQLAECIVFDDGKATKTCWNEEGASLDRQACSARELETAWGRWNDTVKKKKR